MRVEHLQLLLHARAGDEPGTQHRTRHVPRLWLTSAAWECADGVCGRQLCHGGQAWRGRLHQRASLCLCFYGGARVLALHRLHFQKALLRLHRAVPSSPQKWVGSFWEKRGLTFQPGSGHISPDAHLLWFLSSVFHYSQHTSPPPHGVFKFNVLIIYFRERKEGVGRERKRFVVPLTYAFIGRFWLML